MSPPAKVSMSMTPFTAMSVVKPAACALPIVDFMNATFDHVVSNTNTSRNVLEAKVGGA